MFIVIDEYSILHVVHIILQKFNNAIFRGLITIIKFKQTILKCYFLVIYFTITRVQKLQGRVTSYTSAVSRSYFLNMCQIIFSADALQLDTGQILNAPTAHQNDVMLLQIVTDSRNICHRLATRT